MCCHKKFPLPIFCPNLIGSNKFGQDDCFSGYLQLNGEEKCTAVLRKQNSNLVFLFFGVRRVPAQSGVKIDLKLSRRAFLNCEKC